ncbi:MAG: hypothetical protein K6A80_06395 [Saccharofermentans sp.]|nr:hypothetical protein [Saccharofermentans sp.]
MRKKIAAGILCMSVLMCCVGCFEKVEDATAPSESVATTVEATEATEETTESRVVDYADLLSGFNKFELTSYELEDGVWSDVISNTEDGGNESPSLTWEPVDGAALYVIYMVDRDASFWMHWMADAVTSTELPLGWASDGYVGPYPPTGSVHTYDIYVIALGAPLENLKGRVDSKSPNFPDIILESDTDADGNSGNILAYGQVSGTFTGR